MHSLVERPARNAWAVVEEEEELADFRSYRHWSKPSAALAHIVVDCLEHRRTHHTAEEEDGSTGTAAEVVAAGNPHIHLAAVEGSNHVVAAVVARTHTLEEDIRQVEGIRQTC